MWNKEKAQMKSDKLGKSRMPCLLVTAGASVLRKESATKRLKNAFLYLLRKFPAVA